MPRSIACVPRHPVGLERGEGPAGRHRRSGGLREPAGDQRAALHRRPAAA